MLSADQTQSFAGTWGKETKARLGSPDRTRNDYATTSSVSFDAKNFSTFRDEGKNKFAKFRTMKLSGNAVMDSQKSRQNFDLVEESHHDNSNTLCGSTSSSTLQLQKTRSTLLKLTDAPIAVGRSGLRIEKGVSTSGLLGERLMLSKDPQLNSLVQRRWLYSDDPALNYRLNGVPQYQIPEEELAFAIGEELKGNNFKGWTHHRKKAEY